MSLLGICYKVLAIFSLSCSLALPISKNLCFGDLIRIKHHASQKYLVATEKSLDDGKFDLKNSGIRRYKNIFLSNKPDYETLWLIKGDHANNGRWNCKFGTGLLINNKIRLEHLATSCNLTVLLDENLPAIARKISTAAGINDENDNLSIRFCDEQGESLAGNAKTEITPESLLSLIFFASAEKNLGFLTNQDKNLIASPIEGQAESLKPNAVWSFELVEAGFAQTIAQQFENIASQISLRNEFAQISSTQLSNLSLWQEAKSSKITIGTVENIEGTAFLAGGQDDSIFEKKIDRQLASICVQNESSCWATDFNKKIYRSDFKGLVPTNWEVLPDLAENIFAGGHNSVFRLSSCGWGLFKLDKTGQSWAGSPTVDGAVSAAVDLDGGLWWIDLNGNVKYLLQEESLEIFSQANSFQPKFKKISVGGKLKDYYLALLRSDGQVFLSQNGIGFFNIGLNCVSDVAIGQDGIVTLIMHKIDEPLGTIFKSNFKELLKKHDESPVPYKKKFNNFQDLLNYYQYNFELIKKTENYLSYFVLAFFEALDQYSFSVYKDVDLRHFYTIKLQPAVKNKNLSVQSKVAWEKLGAILTDASNLEPENDLKSSVEVEGVQESFVEQDALPAKTKRGLRTKNLELLKTK